MAVALQALSMSVAFIASHFEDASSAITKSSFLAPFKLPLTSGSTPSLATNSRRRAATWRSSSYSYQRIPKQLREENLKDGCCSNFQNEKMETVGSESEAYAVVDMIGLKESVSQPEEEIEKDIQRPKYFQDQEAIAYGIADKIIDSRDAAFEIRNYDEMLLAQPKAMRRAAGAGSQGAPSGSRKMEKGRI